MSPYGSPALGNDRQWCVQDLIRTNLRAVSPIHATFSPSDQIVKKESHTVKIHASSMRTSNKCAKRSNGPAKKPLPKYSSNNEVTVALTVKTADSRTLMCKSNDSVISLV